MEHKLFVVVIVGMVVTLVTGVLAALWANWMGYRQAADAASLPENQQPSWWVGAVKLAKLRREMKRIQKWEM